MTSADEETLSVITALNVDTVNEYTTNAGISVEGVLVKDSYLEISDVADPGAPAAGKGRIYSKSDGIYFHHNGGTTINLTDLNDLTGPLSTSRGGLGADFSASTGSLSIAAGTVSAGVLSVPNGGTGGATFTSNAVLKGNGAGAIASSGVSIDGSNNVSGVNNLTMGGYADITEIATPANPGAGTARIYATSDGVFYRNNAGSEIEMTNDGERQYDAIVDTTAGAADYTSVAAAFTAGAKSVFVRDGTYVETVDIDLPDGGVLIGESFEGVSIDFGANNLSLQAVPGGNRYSTGTIAVSGGSATVTGTGTLWLANVSNGDFILLGRSYYEISTVDTDTTLTLAETYRGDNISGATYVAQTMFSRIIIKNIRVTGTNANGSGIDIRATRLGKLDNISAIRPSADSAIYFKDCSDMTVSRAYSLGPTFNGIEIEDCFSFTLVHSNFSNLQATGIVVTSGGFVSIIDCTCNNNNTGGISAASSNLLVDKCKFDRSGAGVTTSAGTLVTISNCIFTNHANASIDINSTFTTITHCRLDGSGLAIDVDNCIVSNNIVSGSTFTGITINANNTLVLNNHVFDNGSDGIFLSASRIRNAIKGNFIHGHVDGIHLSDSCNETAITGNYIYNNSTIGIRLTNSDDCTIVGNTCTGNGTGINILAGSTGTVLHSNNLGGNTTPLINNGTSTGIEREYIDEITERTAGSGVTVEGVLHRDSYVELADIAAPANPGAGLGRLYKKTGDDGIFWKPDAAGPEVDLTNTGFAGEANTASNEGAGGVGVFKQKTGVNLEFKNINSTGATSGITIVDDVANDEVDVRLDLNSLTEDTAPDVTTDFVVTYDTSAGAHKKVALDNLPGDLYDAIVDTTAGAGDYTSVAAAFTGGASTVFVRNGTYAETANIVIPDGGALIGETAGLVQIDFSTNVASIQALAGGNRYTTGTIAFTSGSTTVTGTGTLWLANIAAGDYIQILTSFYEIASVDTDTTLTLVNQYDGVSVSGESYIAQTMIQGIRVENVEVKANSATRHIHFKAVLNSTVKNVISHINTGSTLALIHYEDCGHSSVVDTTVHNGSDAAIRLEGCFSASISNCTCFDLNASSAGVDIIGGSGIHIVNCTLNSGDAGVDIASATFVEVSNCSFSGNFTGGVVPAATASDIVISNCTFRETECEGIVSRADNVTITNCVIESSANNGGITLTSSSNCNISNCISRSGINGIQLSTCTDISVTGNTCHNNSSNGIRTFSTGNARIALANNICHTNGATGIEINSTTTDCTISGNICYNNTTDGISVAGDDCVITGNRCTSNTSNGLEITAAASNTVISGNHLDGNTGASLNNLGTGTSSTRGDTRKYLNSATDPTAPTPSAGDEYYNTSLEAVMIYDGTRSKWLSAEELDEGCGRNGTTGASTFYRRFNGMVLAAAQGPVVRKGTITGISFSTSVAATHTFEVLVNGAVVASLASGGAATASDYTINADFSAGVMSMRNAAGSASTTNLQARVLYKLRI